MIRPRTSWALTALVCAVLLLGGCPSAANRLAIQQCQFNVRDLAVHGYGPLEIELLVTLGVHNPNDIDVIVDQMDYTVYFEGRKVATGRTLDDVTIPKGREGDLPITLRVNVVDLGMASAALLRGHGLVKVRATYYVKLPWGRQPFPIDVERRI